MNLIDVTEGDSPLVLGLPHTGTFVPPDCLARLNDRGGALADTDWHIETLYAGLAPGATTVRSLVHRYVIDANRGPSDESLFRARIPPTCAPLRILTATRSTCRVRNPTRPKSSAAVPCITHPALECARENGLRLPRILGN